MGISRQRSTYFFALALCTLAVSAVSLWAIDESGHEALAPTSEVAAASDCVPCPTIEARNPNTWPALPRPGGAWEQVEHLISRERFDAMLPWQQGVMANIAINSYQAWKDGILHQRPSLCFQHSVDANVASAWSAANGGPEYFFLSGSWTTTATDGNTGAGLNGIANTLTFSFVPDGTTIPTSGAPDGPSAPSNLIAFLDGIYGTSGSLATRPWFPFFQGAPDAIFDSWAALTGIRYVFEPNDDGGTFQGFPSPVGLPGVIGVRGDVRIGGRFIDGQVGANILAFNYFPDSGDMVIDTSNTTFYGDTSNNSRPLRNVLAHEHGHGIGLAHVCSLSNNFLMEPFINTTFDLMQEDDVRGGNRGYGDRFEFPEGLSDSSGSAVLSGSFVDPDGPGGAGGGFQTQANLSIDRSADEDWWEFSSNVAGFELDVSITPTGTTYDDDPQGAPGGSNDSIGCPLMAISQTNALLQSDLLWTLYESDASTVIASSNSGGLGAAETLTNILVPGTGPWFLRIQGTQNATQMYTMSVTGRVAIGPPTITCPMDVTQECTGAGGNNLSLDFPVTDPNPLSVDVTWTVNGNPVGGTVTIPSGNGTATLNHQFPVGVHTVVATATNTGGLSDMCSMTVTITDTTPPVVTCNIMRTMLWPARNGMIDVGFSRSATDICDPAPSIVVQVYSDEPNGAPPYSPDATLLGTQLKLRMERAYPGGNGRVYLVVVRATDASGNSATACCFAYVPIMPVGFYVVAARNEAMMAQAFCIATGLPPPGYSPLFAFPM